MQENMDAKEHGCKRTWMHENMDAREYGCKRSWMQENMDAREQKGVTDKSFKMLGVMKMMEAGMTAEEVAIHGRWSSKDMPMRYKHNSDEYKSGVAAKLLV